VVKETAFRLLALLPSSGKIMCTLLGPLGGDNPDVYAEPATETLCSFKQNNTMENVQCMCQCDNITLV
jgi:hypothetical protein